MSSARRFRVVALLTCLAALVVIGRALRMSGGVPRSDRSATHEDRADPSEPAAPEEPSLERESVQDASKSTPRAADNVAPSNTASSVDSNLSVRVYASASAAALAPFPGAAVRASRGGDRAATSVAEVVTGPDGVALLEVPTDVDLDLLITATGFAAVRLTARHAGESIDVTLERGASLTGRVFDLATKGPIEGAELVVGSGSPDLPHWNAPSVRTSSDHDGQYRFDGLLPGHVELAVSHDRFSIDRPIEIELTAGEKRIQDLALTGADRVTGLVVDASTHDPIGGAEVAITFGTSSIRTGADGRFVFDGFLRHAHALSARAPGYATVQHFIRKSPTGELTSEVDFALPKEQRARGLVVDPDGKVKAGVTLTAIATDETGDSGTQRFDTASAISDERGAFEILGMASDMRHTLVVRSPGLAVLRFDFPTDAARQEVVDFGVIALRAGTRLHVAVVDEHGASKKELAITLHGSNADRNRLDPKREEDLFQDLYVAEQTAHSDSRGIAVFEDVAPGDYRIQAPIPGTHRTQISALHVPDGVARFDVTFVVPTGLMISGVVKVDDGGKLPKCYVSIDPEHGQDSAGDAECDANGHFNATALLPGPYLITIYSYPSEDDKRAGRKFDVMKVPGVEAGRTDVEITLKKS